MGFWVTAVPREDFKYKQDQTAISKVVDFNLGPMFYVTNSQEWKVNSCPTYSYREHNGYRFKLLQQSPFNEAEMLC